MISQARILEWVLFPTPGDLPDQGLNLHLLHWQAHFFTTAPPGKHFTSCYFSSVQLLSRVQFFATPWIAAHQASLSITNSCNLLKLMSIDAIQPSHPLSSPSPPAFNLSKNQGLFQRVSSSHQVAKVLEFQLQHQSFQ